MRVLVHDRDVVMYDAWWPHLDNWGLSSLEEICKKRISYYVTTVSALGDKATYLRREPLTADELAIHRPDLPFAVAQCAAISWPATPPTTAAQWAETWSAVGCPENVTLQVPQVCLYPFGSRGGQKAGVRVKADNGAPFTTGELAWKAAAIQAPFVSDASPANGIGIYRSGLHRGIPAYYLWGSERAGFAQVSSP